MAFRLKVLAERGLDLATIQKVIGGLDPLPGAFDFLTWARRRFQVVIVSDTFYEFAGALMPKLGSPLLLCHRLRVQQGRITGYTLRQTDSKRHAVKAFRALNFEVIAAGDSFNDIPMLEEASHGFFYRAPPNIVAQYPQFASARDYAELEGWLAALL